MSIAVEYHKVWAWRLLHEDQTRFDIGKYEKRCNSAKKHDKKC